MGHIRYASDVGAPTDAAFAYTENFQHLAHWMAGVTSVTAPGSAPERGLGASCVLKVRLYGAIPMTLTCEITEYRRGAVIGYTLRGRVYGTVTLRFDPLGYERSVLTAEADYPPPRGVFGRMCHGLVDAAARSALRRTESRLRREIEAFHGTDLVGRIA
ncbi:SRPBCC family protein [Nocardia caishijiensis]|uniref:Polyketide cyclase/dehydrase/lipid transport protein n=1 Tax=Nocardia caishijiensis TaxID=184756 RepID=A0ABQ6YUM4_9NOCA|nr:SRPBCC family protein [Nocardia caishijiensis]KAF0849475.1 polyketide cyclase/dehydrase/lipid transport protein [Nocardia caishijiensis]